MDVHRRSARGSVVMALALIATMATMGIAQDHDRPVERLDLSPTGEFRAGIMHWYGRGLFPYWSWDPPELVLLGEVEQVDPPIEHEYRTEVNGRIRIDRVLRCPERFASQAQGMRTLVTDGCNQLSEGDRVLVCLTPYEGGYAIPIFQTNCNLGFRISSGWHEETCAELLALFASDRAWQPDSLSVAELRIWAAVDPFGTATYLIDVRDPESYLHMR